MNKTKLFVLILIVLAFLSACQPGEDTPTPPALDGEYTYGEDAIIDSLEVLLMESFPVQAQVLILGNLPDGCTELHEITVDKEGQEFILTLTTRRPAGDIACTEALVPFEESVSLDIEGLEAGTYTVIAQEEQAAFTLDVDNAILEEAEQGAYVFGADARVEAMVVQVIESYPIQVSVLFSGYLPDGCSEIERINAIRDGYKINVDIVTRRPAGDVMCTQAIVPFEETLNLDVENLTQGLYTVQYENLSESFRLE